MSWNLLTGPFGLKPTSLYITYFGGDKNLGLEPDVETREIWREIGVQDSHIIPFGIRDNFWEMASTGPCGTSTEIHYDLFPDRSNAGDRVNKGFPDLIELWNIVFIEFHRMDTDQLIKLPIRHVDTGMGFERLVAVLQGKLSNYDTDLFQPIISAITKKTGVPPYGGRFTEASSSIGAELDWGYRILADHARMFTVALTDGMFPDQNHRLRRVLRKAMLVSKDIFGCDCELLTELTYHVAESLSDIFPEVGNRLKQIHCIIAHEEELYRFLRHDALSKWLKIVERRPQLESLDIVDIPGLVAGFQQLEKILPPLTNDNASGTSLGNNSIRHLPYIPVHHLNDESVFQINSEISNTEPTVFPTDIAFKLYDTYGISKETIVKLASLEGFKFDFNSFDHWLNNAKLKSKESFKYLQVDEDLMLQVLKKLQEARICETNDSFKYIYFRDEKSDNYCFPVLMSRVRAIIVNGIITQNVVAGTNCALILESTNFYSEAGGQMGDTGHLIFSTGVKMRIECVENFRGYVLHKGIINGNADDSVSVDEIATLEIDVVDRLNRMRNHTATHLVNASLHSLLTVTCQKSSKVTHSDLVFDFSLYGQSPPDIMKLENMVQQVIKNSAPVKIYNLTSTQLLQMQNVTLVPGEVYPEDNIKLVEVFSNILTSREPCCGTHVCNTSDLVEFSVVNLHSIGAGIRSLQAVTGSAADQAMNKGVVANKRLEELSLIVRKHLAEDIENKEKANDINKHISNFEQDLKNRENLLPYIVRVRCLEDLTCLKKQLKEGMRGSLRDSLKTEMLEVMDSFSKNNEEFIVHFLSCSSHMATVPLQKATNICSNVPVLLIAISEGLVKARCCVPKHNVSEHFNAESWMHTILSIFQASGGPPRGQNPHITYNMKGKKIPESEIKELLDKSLKSATNFAVKHFKQ
nr:unnamed protein product [Timema poppensis]